MKKVIINVLKNLQEDAVKGVLKMKGLTLEKVEVFPKWFLANTGQWNFTWFFNYKVKSLRTTS